MISLKERLMTHPKKTLTRLVNSVRNLTELPDFLKLSTYRKRFTKEQLADHLVKLNKTKYFDGKKIKEFKSTPTTPQERKEIAKRKKEDKKDKMVKKEVKIPKEEPKEEVKKEEPKKKKVKFIVVSKEEPKKATSKNPWIAHVKAYAKENNMKYNEALEFAGKTYKKK